MQQDNMGRTMISYSTELRRLTRNAGVERLDTDGAFRLFGAMMDGGVPELELGALWVALAAGTETADVRSGFHQALGDRVQRWRPPSARMPVVLPAYGLHPGNAHFIPLLAMLLRRFDVPVLVHGPIESPHATSLASVLRELGVMPCAGAAQAQAELDAGRVSFVPVGLLSPGLAALVALRNRLGVNSAAQVVAHAVEPFDAPSLRVVSCVPGHASERIEVLAEETGGETLVLAWPAGRTPAQLHARPRVERIRDGVHERLFEAEVKEVRAAPGMPDGGDARELAEWIRRAAAGSAPLPMPVVNVLAACLYASGYTTDFTQAKAIVALQTGRLAA
jgi:anthranilate phosphoribosyltransferase